jgi:hypothetical protein
MKFLKNNKIMSREKSHYENYNHYANDSVFSNNSFRDVKEQSHTSSMETKNVPKFSKVQKPLKKIIKHKKIDYNKLNNNASIIISSNGSINKMNTLSLFQAIITGLSLQQQTQSLIKKSKSLEQNQKIFRQKYKKNSSIKSSATIILVS